MALSSEDKADVSRAFGKKTANKVSRVTHDEPLYAKRMRKNFETGNAKAKALKSIMEKKYGGHGKGTFTANGGWKGKNAGGGHFESGFGGRDNS